MNNLIEELTKLVETCSKEELKAVKDKLWRLSDRINSRESKIKLEEEKMKKDNLKQRFEYLLKTTEFFHPTYPDMGVEGEPGSCVFSNAQEAKELVDILKNQDYYYNYILNYEGPGKYIIEPTFALDHDGDHVFTAFFNKEGL